MFISSETYLNYPPPDGMQSKLQIFGNYVFSSFRESALESKEIPSGLGMQSILAFLFHSVTRKEGRDIEKTKQLTNNTLLESES